MPDVLLVPYISKWHEQDYQQEKEEKQAGI